MQDLLVSQPDTGEQALEITDMLVRSGAVDVVVIDSVAALTPKAEIEGEMGELQMGLHARLMSQALRKLTGNIKRSNTIVIFINQIRMKIGVMFGNPETTTGGNALKFYASVRLDIRRIGAIKNGEEVVGNQTRVKVVKNKVAPPFREAEFEIMYGSGISREGEIIELGATNGIIDKSGAWYSYNGERIGQGKDNTRVYLQQHKDIAAEIEEKIRAKLLPPAASVLRKRQPKASRDQRAGRRSGGGAGRGRDAAGAARILSGELGAKLAARASSPTRSRAALAELIERRYLDDERYAAQFVALSRASAARGRVRIRRDLAELGLAGGADRSGARRGRRLGGLAREVRDAPLRRGAAGSWPREGARRRVFAIPWLFHRSYPAASAPGRRELATGADD